MTPPAIQAGVARARGIKTELRARAAIGLFLLPLPDYCRQFWSVGYSFAGAFVGRFIKSAGVRGKREFG